MDHNWVGVEGEMCLLHYSRFSNFNVCMYAVSRTILLQTDKIQVNLNQRKIHHRQN